jgi:hypothetical protein
VTDGLPSTGGNQTADFVIRLERSGNVKFFRLRHAMQFGDTSLGGMEAALCEILKPANGPEVNTFVQSILTAFFGNPSSKTKLVITNNSITDAELDVPDISVPGSNPLHAATLLNVTIYAQ